MLVAWDIDGIFLSDIIFNEEYPFDLSFLLLKRRLSKPIFVPTNKYYLITGRPKCDETVTKEWIEYFFIENPPLKIFQNDIIGDCRDTPKIFKAKILNENKDIDIFIESDESQVKYLKENTSCNIIHWNTLLTSNLERMINEYTY